MPSRKLLSEKLEEELQRMWGKVEDIEPANIKRTMVSVYKNLLEIHKYVIELEEAGAIKKKRRSSGEKKPLNNYQVYLQENWAKVSEMLQKKGTNKDDLFTAVNKKISDMWKKDKDKVSTKKPKKSSQKKTRKPRDSDSGSEFTDENEDNMFSDDVDESDSDNFPVRPRKGRSSSSGSEASSTKPKGKGKSKGKAPRSSSSGSEASSKGKDKGKPKGKGKSSKKGGFFDEYSFF